MPLLYDGVGGGQGHPSMGRIPQAPKICLLSGTQIVYQVAASHGPGMHPCLLYAAVGEGDGRKQSADTVGLGGRIDMDGAYTKCPQDLPSLWDQGRLSSGSLTWSWDASMPAVSCSWGGDG